MKQYLKYIAVAVITLIVSLSISSEASKYKIIGGNNDSQTDQYQIFKKIIEITKKNYVEEIDEEKLFYSAFDGMLRSLDPHSGFLNADDFKEIHVQTNGEFGGVGIEITMDNGFLKVVSPIDDTPAFKAGIKPADYITMIDGESVRDLNINQAVQKIRGPKGSIVKLTVIREGASEPLEFALKRATIKIDSVKSKLLADDVAYLRITSFSKNTTDGIEAQYKKLLAKTPDIKGVILDLRNNPGGLLDQSVGVTSLFLDGGVVVSTKGRNKTAEQVFNAEKGDILDGKPIVVLINQGSASASEIVAGALQDHKRAVVIGVKSFGKGSVQTVVPLDKKLGMRLTTSKYYTPSGSSIQAQGITPDILVAQTPLEIEERPEYVSEAKLSGHLTDKDAKEDKAKKEANDSITKLYADDYQLARAIDLLHGLAVLR